MPSEAVGPESLGTELMPFEAFEAVHPESSETDQERMKRRVRWIQYIYKNFPTRTIPTDGHHVDNPWSLLGLLSAQRNYLLRINHNNDLMPFEAFEAVDPESTETDKERMERLARWVQYIFRNFHTTTIPTDGHHVDNPWSLLGSLSAQRKYLLRIKHNNEFRVECDYRFFDIIESIYNSYGGSTVVGEMLLALLALEAQVDLLNDVKNHDTRILHRTEDEIMKLEQIIEIISERCNDLKKKGGYVDHNELGIVQSWPAADSSSSVNPMSVETNTKRRVKRKAVVLQEAIHRNPRDATDQSKLQTMGPMRLGRSMDLQVSSKCVQSMPKTKTIKTDGSDATSNAVGSAATGTTAKDDDRNNPLSRETCVRDMHKFLKRLCDCTKARTLCDAEAIRIRKTIEQSCDAETMEIRKANEKSCDGSKHFSRLCQMKIVLTMWLDMWNSAKIDDQTTLKRIGTALTNLVKNIEKLRKRYDEFMLKEGYVNHNAHGLLKARTAAGGLSLNSERELPEGGPPSGS